MNAQACHIPLYQLAQQWYICSSSSSIININTLYLHINSFSCNGNQQNKPMLMSKQLPPLNGWNYFQCCVRHQSIKKSVTKKHTLHILNVRVYDKSWKQIDFIFCLFSILNVLHNVISIKIVSIGSSLALIPIVRLFGWGLWFEGRFCCRFWFRL